MKTAERYEKLTRICSHCKKEFPLNSDFFHKGGMGRFKYKCKVCSISLRVHKRKPHDLENKKCSKCKVVYKRTDEFFGKTNQTWDGLRHTCKKCYRELGRKYYHKRKLIPECKKRMLEYGRRNRKKIKQDRNLHARCMEYHRVYNNSKYISDMEFKIEAVLRQRLRHALKGKIKIDSAINLLGCSIEDFTKWIESLFQEGMSWDNYGKGQDRWNIDHKIPCAYFNLSLPYQQKVCFHYSNLVPLWQPHNATKSSTYKGIHYNKHKRNELISREV